MTTWLEASFGRTMRPGSHPEVRHDEGADEARGDAPASATRSARGRRGLELRLEGGEVLAQVVAGAGLRAFLSTIMASMLYVRRAPANRSDSDLRPVITGMACSPRRRCGRPPASWSVSFSASSSVS